MSLADATLFVSDSKYTVVDISNIGISKHFFLYLRILFGHISYFPFCFNSRYLKLLVSLSKFSGPRKFTLRHQLFETKQQHWRYQEFTAIITTFFPSSPCISHWRTVLQSSTNKLPRSMDKTSCGPRGQSEW